MNKAEEIHKATLERKALKAKAKKQSASLRDNAAKVKSKQPISGRMTAEARAQRQQAKIEAEEKRVADVEKSKAANAKANEALKKAKQAKAIGKKKPAPVKKKVAKAPKKAIQPTLTAGAAKLVKESGIKDISKIKPGEDKRINKAEVQAYLDNGGK